MKNCDNLRILELSPREQLKINGGFWPVVVGAYLVANYIYENWDDFETGVQEGHEALYSEPALGPFAN